MGKSTLCSELAGALAEDERQQHAPFVSCKVSYLLKVLARLNLSDRIHGMREWTCRSSLTSTLSKEFARHMLRVWDYHQYVTLSFTEICTYSYSKHLADSSQGQRAGVLRSHCSHGAPHSRMEQALLVERKPLPRCVFSCLVKSSTDGEARVRTRMLVSVSRRRSCDHDCHWWSVGEQR